MAPRLQAASTYVRKMFTITEAVKKWRQYLLGRRFSIQTDHQSLRTLLQQVIQTPEQQRWLWKLVGFDFDIEFKPGVLNGPADALSRMPIASYTTLLSESTPQLILWEAIKQAYKHDIEATTLLERISKEPGQLPNFILRDGLLLFKGLIWIPANSTLQTIIIAEFHSTPTGGHAGIHRSTARLASVFYWPELGKTVRAYVSKCTIC